ncbi:hypothetical protein FMUND_15232 [Fusarium mundagurra]|uniref:Uncharacterized protein n=1 Tax=Fusarium mundagurra TaxID=1567541 RepID=A0A8H5XR65_9HYPO|nr:hypothetical protein FMUND_15232 [Fusarium mundagurra]
MRILISILTYVVSSIASSISSPPITTDYVTYPSLVVTSSPLPACPSNALCAHTVCIEEVHVLGTKTVTEVTTVVSTLIKPVTSWITTTSTVTVPGKDCTVTSHRVTSKYDITTVSLTETSFVTIDSVVYATKTVIETVSELCGIATGPTPPIDSPIPITSDGPQPIVTDGPSPTTTDGPSPITTNGPDPNAAQSSVIIVEYEADYVTAWTSAPIVLSTEIPLPIPRTATVEENPNPGRVTLPQCASEGKLTYSFLQGYGWDNVAFNKPSDPNTDFTFGPVSFKAMNWKYLDKPNIIEQGTHPVLEAITGQGAFTLVNPAEAAKLQQFAIELPEDAELPGVRLEFTFHVSHTTGNPFTWNFNISWFPSAHPATVAKIHPPPPKVKRQADKIANGAATDLHTVGQDKAVDLVQTDGDNIDGQLTQDAATLGAQVGGDEEDVLERTGDMVPSKMPTRRARAF